MRPGFGAAAFAALGALLCGCIPVSLSPVYTEKDAVAEPKLEGAWADAEAKDSQKRGADDWDFTVCPAKDGALAIRVKDGETMRQFAGRLTRLGKALILDLQPLPTERDNFMYHLIPAHSVNRLWLEPPGLRSAMIRQKWLEEGLRDKKFALPSRRVGDQLVLTASTEELRTFLQEHADDEGAFDNPGNFRRVGPCPKG